jgi:hypothetical protein
MDLTNDIRSSETSIKMTDIISDTYTDQNLILILHESFHFW